MCFTKCTFYTVNKWLFYIYKKKPIIVKLQYLIVIMVISCLIRMVITLFLGFYVASFSSIVSLSPPLDICFSICRLCWRGFLSQSIRLSLLYLTQGVRTFSHACTRTHTHTHTHLCLQLSRRSTALNGLSLPVVPCEQHSFVLQVFNPQVLYSSSCRQLCHQGCSWKDPSSDFVMQHRSDACRVVEAGNKTTLNMWFRTHLCCLKSVAVWWQPELSAQYSSDYVNVSVGQITVVMPLCALDRITWRTAAQACWQI